MKFYEDRDETGSYGHRSAPYDKNDGYYRCVNGICMPDQKGGNHYKSRDEPTGTPENF